MTTRLARCLAHIFTDGFVQLSPLNLCHMDLLHEETPRSIPENCVSAPAGWGQASGQRTQGHQGNRHHELVRWTAVPLSPPWPGVVCSCSLHDDARHYGDLITLLSPHLDLLEGRSLALFFPLYPLN